MNGFMRRYFSPADAGGVTPPATPPASPAAPPAVTPAAAPSAAAPAAAPSAAAPVTPAAGGYVKPNGTFIDKFWEHADFPAELKDNMQVRTWAGVGDLLQNWHGMHKTYGFDKIAIPGKDARPEVWDANVWHRLGTPKEPKGYTVPDYAASGLDPKYKASDEDQQAFLGAAHQARLTDWQLGTLVKEMQGLAKTKLTAAEAAATQAREQAMAPIKSRLGGKYEETRTSLENFLRSYVKPEGFEEAKALLDRPHLFEFFEQMAPAFAEAEKALELANTPADVLAAGQAEVEKLAVSKAYLDEFDPEHAATVRTVNELRTMLMAAQAKKS